MIPEMRCTDYYTCYSDEVSDAIHLSYPVSWSYNQAIPRM